MAEQSPQKGRSILVAGATGYIGRAVVRELVQRGFRVVALVRQLSGDPVVLEALHGAELRVCDVCSPHIVDRGIRGDSFDAVISCIASRSGTAEDAWKIDRDANINLLDAVTEAGIPHFILLSSICAQKPVLENHKAKLAFESVLQDSGLRFSIVRPTRYFSALAGQLERGGRVLLLGEGGQGECKPISQGDVARFIADCIDDGSKHDQVLPVGGPGPALTHHQQGELLFQELGKKPRFWRLPPGMLERYIGLLDGLSRFFPGLSAKADAIREWRYYATEPMLVWDEKQNRYDANATPEYGTDTLQEFFCRELNESEAGE